ncbi:MAG: ABC transporter substrate-binding protein, partial [Thermomicrobiales bacterium]
VGVAAYGLAPEGIGIEGIVRTQSFDSNQARQLLDAAGWIEGDGGIREKDGARLTFNLGYYQSRPELEGLAIAIQDQLKEIGVDATPLLDADINTTVAENTFDATLYSYGVAPNGDVDRALLSLYSPSGTNTDRYSNPAVNELIDQYRQASDPAERQALFEQTQIAIGDDVPVVYLINPYQIVGMSSDVTGFTPYPLENRKVDISLGLKG